jgi:putative membrane protein
MRRFIVKWLLNILSFYIAAAVISGMRVVDLKAGICAGLVLGLMHLLLRPLLLLMALPVNLLTLGIFTVVIDTWLVILTDKFFVGITIPGFWAAMLTALIIYGVNLVLRESLNDD